MKTNFFIVAMIFFGQISWAQTPLPELHPAASLQDQYHKINQHIAGNKVRLLFFWTSGLFGHGKTSLPLGGALHGDFFRFLDEILTHVPTLTAEVIIDHVIHEGSLHDCVRLKKKHGTRFITPLLETRLAQLHTQALDNMLQHEHKYPTQQLEAVIHALENGLYGNPAIASDVARIWFLHEKPYWMNLYVDVDTFVHNARKLLLAEIFPKTRQENNLVRMDLIKEGISNDLIADFGILPEVFQRVRSNFVDKQLMDPEQQKISDIYKEKWQALSSDHPIERYKDSIKKACDVLRHDFERLKQTGTSKFMSSNGLCGLSIPIALLSTFGPGSHYGAQTFSQELYHGEKPSANSWATFIWTPATALDKDIRLQWLVSYLSDWALFKKIAQPDFLKKLAKEVISLHDQIQLTGKDGKTRTGLACFQDPDVKTDEHSQGAHSSLKAIFDEMVAFALNKQEGQQS